MWKTNPEVSGAAPLFVLTEGGRECGGAPGSRACSLSAAAAAHAPRALSPSSLSPPVPRAQIFPRRLLEFNWHALLHRSSCEQWPLI